MVDDDADTLEALAVLLDGEGHDVTRADSGRKALELCASHRFDCLLLDVTLGDTTGLAVARILSQNPHIRPRRVVLLSGHPRTDFLHELHGKLVDGYLPKPADLKDLAAVVRQSLSGMRDSH